ncbi:CDA_G0037760.mRNA.1.CDS.1 [Saccharomyces cerevisiae]|nr:CDA_G0037760.mRNA.1.CDS.1 [Saccharomyces cerevisiae]CAI7412672.1 CDA_G0037760.mRNA.1.CDS.1 [Saccharomyces cerevisiae]
MSDTNTSIPNTSSAREADNASQTPSISSSSNTSTTTNTESSSASLSSSPSTSELTSIRPIGIVVAAYDFNYPIKKDSSSQLLSVQQGETIYILNKNSSGWWDGLVIDDSNGKVNRGWFPQNFGRPLRDSHLRKHSHPMKKYSSSKSSRRSSLNSLGNSAYLHVPRNPSKSRRGSSTLSASLSNAHNAETSSGHNNTVSMNNSPFSAPNDASHITPQSSNFNSNASLSQDMTKSANGSSEMNTNAIMNNNETNLQTSGEKAGPPLVAEETIKILPLEEIEMIINGIHSNIASTWSPIPLITKTSDYKLVYYNKDLDIYCSELPLISNSIMESDDICDSEPKFPPNDHLVNLYTRDLRKNANIEDSSTRSKQSESEQNRSSLLMEKQVSKETDGNNNSINDDDNNNENNKNEFNEAGPSSLNSLSAPDLTQNIQSRVVAPSRSSILAKSDIFYHYSRDIKLWTELQDLTVYYTKTAHKMFLKKNRLNFTKYFDLISDSIVFTQLGCRLMQHEIKAKSCSKEIKKIFKGLISSLSRISINSHLYFDSAFHRKKMDTMNDKDNDNQENNCSRTEGDDGKIEVDSVHDLVSVPLSGKRNVSTSTTDTLTPMRSSFSTVNENDMENFSGLGPRNSVNSVVTPRTSIQNSTLEDFSPSNKNFKSAKSIYEMVDVEFSKFLRHVQLLYFVLQSSVFSDDNTLPQLLPRFFKGSFSGGSWTNPFSTFITDEFGNATKNKAVTSNEVTASSSKNSSISRIPPKMADAIASASGYSANSETNSQIDLKASSAASGSVFTPFNRPSHNRTFSRARVSKRKKKYPLTVDTLNTMKKKSSQIFEKLNNATGEHLKIISKPKSRIRNLEINSSTYEQINQNVLLLEILENLDLSIFINLKNLIKTPSILLDLESEEFLVHAMSSVSSVLTEFFDIKQAFHDIVIRLIMTTQQTTLDDPYLFSSMRSNFPVGHHEPFKNISNTPLVKGPFHKKNEQLVLSLFHVLVSQDVEFNNLEFLNNSDDFKDACEKYVEISNLACIIVDQLIEERENLLNYAARMMKNNLTAELLKGEQEKWFDIYSEDYSDDDSENDEAIIDDELGSEDYIERKAANIEKNLPWFLTSDYETSLVYDSRGKIRGGTKEALIEHLTSHELVDAAFNVTMLITFRSILTAREFFYALIYRYNLYPPEGLSYDDYNIWIEKKSNPIKCRVVNIMRTFLTQYWTRNYYEPGIPLILNFAKMVVSEKIPGAEDLLQKINEKLINENEKEPVDPKQQDSVSAVVQTTKRDNKSPIHMSSSSLPSSASSAFFRLKKLKLLDIDPYTYATQLTVLEHDLYLRITMFECLDRAWGTKYCNMGGSPNITKFIANANTLTNFVSYTIVKQADVKTRSKLTQYFVTVAQHCKELNNFSSMTAIVSALYSSPIYRLKKTWDLVSTESKDLLKNLNNLMDSKRNFVKYRELLRSVTDVACVPFFGVYLSDLTFTFVGNPDFLHNSTNIINFSKRTKIANIVEEIISFKRFHYKLKRLDDIQTVIEASLENVPHIEKQYQLSLQVEPRSGNTKGSTHASSASGTKTAKFLSEFTDDKNGNFLKLGKKKPPSRLFR